MSQGSFNPNIRFLGHKVCPAAREQTDTHESDYCGHWAPFQGFRIFSFNLSRIGPMQTVGHKNKNRGQLSSTSLQHMIEEHHKIHYSQIEEVFVLTPS